MGVTKTGLKMVLSVSTFFISQALLVLTRCPAAKRQPLPRDTALITRPEQLPLTSFTGVRPCTCIFPNTMNTTALN